MRQRLYQRVTAFAGGDGSIVFDFPPVPQGLVWTGSITLYEETPTHDTVPPLHSARWELTRNDTPVVSYSGQSTVTDLQAISQEVVSLRGTQVVPLSQVTATWTGYSDDAADAPILYPVVLMGGLPTTQDDPGRLKITTSLISAASTTDIMFFGIGTVQYSLWELSLAVSGADSATTATAIPLLGQIQMTDGTVLLRLEPIITQTSNNGLAVTLPMHGFRTPPGYGLEAVSGSFPGGSSLRVTASALYSQVY